MTIDPAIVVAAIAALGGLLIFIVRLFLTGALIPRSVVPREDYEALKEVNASYAPAILEVAAAVKKVGVSVELLRKLLNGAKR